MTTVAIQLIVVYVGDNKTEPCPNGCGPLWPVTWEQEARNCWKTLEEMHERLQAAPAAQADSLDHLHNLLYAAQTSTGGAQMQAITDARIYLSKLRHAHHKQGETNGKAS